MSAVFHFRDCPLTGSDQLDGCAIQLREGNSRVVGDFERGSRRLQEKLEADRARWRPKPHQQLLDLIEPPSEEDREEDREVYLW